jgi:hypothetical protein
MSSPGTIRVKAKSGGSASQFVTGTFTFPWHIRNDGTNVYFVEWTNGGAVYQVPTTGGTATPIVPNLQSPIAVAVHSGVVYFATTKSVSSVQVGGGTVTPIATNESKVKTLAADDSGVYWTTESGSVRRAPLGSTTVTTIFQKTGEKFNGITLNAQGIYWAGDTALYALAKP